MSAAYSIRGLAATRRLSELDVTWEISRWVLAAKEIEPALDKIAAAILCLRGVRAIRIEPSAALAPYLDAARSWGARSSSESIQATAEIAAWGSHWGRYRISFDLRECKLESPLRFCRFTAEQVACLVGRLALLHEQHALQQRNARLKQRLATRKIVGRASGLLAQRHQISHLEAQRLLIGITRSSRLSLRRIAQSIVFAGV